MLVIICIRRTLAKGKTTFNKKFQPVGIFSWEYLVFQLPIKALAALGTVTAYVSEMVAASTELYTFTYIGCGDVHPALRVTAGQPRAQ